MWELTLPGDMYILLTGESLSSGAIIGIIISVIAVTIFIVSLVYTYKYLNREQPVVGKDLRFVVNKQFVRVTVMISLLVVMFYFCIYLSYLLNSIKCALINKLM